MAPRARPPTVVRPSRDARFVLRYSVPLQELEARVPVAGEGVLEPRGDGGLGVLESRGHILLSH